MPSSESKKILEKNFKHFLSKTVRDRWYFVSEISFSCRQIVLVCCCFTVITENSDSSKLVTRDFGEFHINRSGAKRSKTWWVFKSHFPVVKYFCFYTDLLLFFLIFYRISFRYFSLSLCFSACQESLLRRHRFLNCSSEILNLQVNIM